MAVAPLLLSCLFCLSWLSSTSASAIVKRDVLSDAEDAVGDLGDSLKNSLGLGSTDDVLDKIADMDRDKYCVKDADCSFQPLQHCNTSEFKVYGICEFVVVFWIAAAAAISLLFCSCITSALCCCCSSLCRKAT